MMRRESPEDGREVWARMEIPERPRVTSERSRWMAVEAVEADRGARGKGADKLMLVVTLYRDTRAWPPAYMVKADEAQHIFTGAAALEEADTWARRVYGVGVATASARLDRDAAFLLHRAGGPGDEPGMAADEAQS